jgi:hypothetical protein
MQGTYALAVGMQVYIILVNAETKNRLASES